MPTNQPPVPFPFAIKVFAENRKSNIDGENSMGRFRDVCGRRIHEDAEVVGSEWRAHTITAKAADVRQAMA